jgi:hypothetical protein
VTGHSAAGREDTLSGDHAFNIFRGGFFAGQDYRTVFRFRFGGIGGEKHPSASRAG